MDISSITGTGIQNTIDSTKNKVSDDSFEQKLQNAMSSKDDKELKDTCKQFESIMLSMMYKEMKSTIDKSDLIPQDMGNEVFDSMLDDKLMDQASQGTGIGLSDILYKQLSKQAQAAYNPGK